MDVHYWHKTDTLTAPRKDDPAIWREAGMTICLPLSVVWAMKILASD
jgi:hypothetical protein